MNADQLQRIEMYGSTPDSNFASEFRQKITRENRSGNRRRKRIYLPASILLVLIMLVARQGKFPSAASSLPTAGGPTSSAASAQVLSPALPTQEATPTAGILLSETPVVSQEQTSPISGLDAVPPTPAPDPLRISFPQPPPAPVSAWRPPLYPAPWALSPYDHFYFTRPIAADEINWPLWDYRYGGNFFDGVTHTGIDITAPKGTPVLAAGAGEVIWAGYGLYRGGNDPTDPYGMAVAIHHDFGYQGQDLYTIYGHMDRVDVMDGQHVEAGEMLGLSGETGKVTGPHLHFEVRLGKNDFFSTRNPELWLVPPQGWGVLAGRMLDSGHHPMPGADIVIHSQANAQNWLAKTYGKEAVNSDPYYRENLVVGDLPAGFYEIRISFWGFSYKTTVQIRPGEITYFTFYGRDGFDLQLPEAPGAEFNPNTE